MQLKSKKQTNTMQIKILKLKKIMQKKDKNRQSETSPVYTK